jgi:hypothetical protein
MPDIATMMTLPVNVGQGFSNADYGNIDLVQGAIAYKAFVKSLAAGSDVDGVVRAANTALTNGYWSTQVPPNGKRLPQVVFTRVEGSTNICPACRR